MDFYAALQRATASVWHIKAIASVADGAVTRKSPYPEVTVRRSAEGWIAMRDHDQN